VTIAIIVVYGGLRVSVGTTAGQFVRLHHRAELGQPPSAWRGCNRLTSSLIGVELLYPVLDEPSQSSNAATNRS